jgi:hypothetical protein
LAVRLHGWRIVWALKRQIHIPVTSITSVARDPKVYETVPTKVSGRKGMPRLFRLGVHHGREGFSFWACGIGKNAVLIETVEPAAYRFVVVEVPEPDAVVTALRLAAGLAPGGEQPIARIWNITEAKRRGSPNGADGGGDGPQAAGGQHPPRKDS